MRRDQEVTGDRRSWWFWPTIVIVIVAVVVLIAWTLVQTSAVGTGAHRPPFTDPMTAIAARAIC